MSPNGYGIMEQLNHITQPLAAFVQSQHNEHTQTHTRMCAYALFSCLWSKHQFDLSCILSRTRPAMN